MLLLDTPFAEALRRFEASAPGGAEVPAHTALFREYTALCHRAVEALEAELAPPGGERLPAAERRGALDELALLRAERNTWYLLEWLFNDWRTRAAPAAPAAPAAAPLFWGCADEQGVVDALFEADAALAAARAAVQWLESVAYERVEFVRTDAFHRNTLFRLSAGIETEGLVTEADADAPSRLRLPLDVEDQSDERALLAGAWQLVRAGRLDEAQRLCAECGQPWRAATLDGGQLWQRRGGAADRLPGAVCAHAGPHDDGDPDAAGTVDSWVGNPHRAAWLESCRHLAAAAAEPYEAALYGYLCGHAAAMEAVGAGWEDAAWARLHALVHGRVQEALEAARAARGEGGGERAPRGVGRVDELAVHAALGADAGGNEDGGGGGALALLEGVQRLLVLDSVRRSSLDSAQSAAGRLGEVALAIERGLRGLSAALEALETADGEPSERAPGCPLLAHAARFGAHLVLFLRHASAVDSARAQEAAAAPSRPEPLPPAVRGVQATYARALALLLSDCPQTDAAARAASARLALCESGGGAEPLLPAALASQAAQLCRLEEEEAEAEGAEGGAQEEAMGVVVAYLRRWSALASEEQQLAVLSACLPQLGERLLCDAACEALRGLERWWPRAASEAARLRAGGGSEPWEAFRALRWLALPLPGESGECARTRLSQALVHANRLTALLVEAGQLSHLLAPTDEEADGADDGPPGGELRSRLSLVLGAERVNELWVPAPQGACEWRVNNAVAEYYSWGAYLHALAAYNRWWAFASSVKDPLLSASRGAQGPQPEEWRASLHALAEDACAALEGALRSPHGWLEDHHDGGVPATGAGKGAGAADAEGSLERRARLTRLKAHCVPQMVELLHSVLLQTARLDSSAAYANRALQWVAELVADDHYRLYAHFPPARLRTLLGLLRKSALVVFELQAN